MEGVPGHENIEDNEEGVLRFPPTPESVWAITLATGKKRIRLVGNSWNILMTHAHSKLFSIEPDRRRVIILLALSIPELQEVAA